MRSFVAVFAFATVATPSAAAIVETGTMTGLTGESLVVPLSMFEAPGSYRSYIAFSAPGSFSLRYQVIRTTNFFCDFDDGQGFVACGGDDVPVGFDLFAGPGATAATLFYAIAAPFREDYSPTQYGLVFDHAEGADFEFTFESDGSVSYRVVSTPVPEPANWALMVGGFAATGMAMRRRARSAARA